MVMGNDEFILYIRKHYPNCDLLNRALGKRIYQKILQLDPTAQVVQYDALCYWGDEGNFVAENNLPKTAAQISFKPAILQDLFKSLDEMGMSNEL